VLAGTRLEGYSFRDQTISELGAIGAASKPLFSALLFVVYALVTAFGVGVWKAARGTGRLAISGGLIVGLGVLALTVGQFASMRLRGSDQGLAGTLHLAEGLLAMLMTFSAMGFAAAALGRRFRLYTIATIVFALVFGAWSAMDIPRVGSGLATPWVGVKERLFWYGYQSWFIVLAFTILHQVRSGRAKVFP